MQIANDCSLQGYLGHEKQVICRLLSVCETLQCATCNYRVYFNAIIIIIINLLRLKDE